MDKSELYDALATRKSAPKDFGTYIGDNGRVNRCVQFFEEGKIKKGGSLLDVGGGIGDLCYSVKQKGLFEHAFLVDISAKNMEAAQSKGIGGVVTDVDRHGLCVELEDSYDVVTALDFIEHIIDPENFARECFRVLKPGGQVFINTPNFQYFEILENLLFRGHFSHTSGDKEVYHGGHLSFFVRKDLDDIFTKAGFKNCKQLKDEDGYRNPPEMFVKFLSPKNQSEYTDCCMRLGNPNLLFVCEK